MNVCLFCVRIKCLWQILNLLFDLLWAYVKLPINKKQKKKVGHMRSEHVSCV